mmetsp:Transcript_27035/g.32930  ORF Transcript_27035/g.32930 Transcript_27035/m.32930 type:complete len:197 (+) Transcript_27035:30-620(+)
MLCKQLGMFDVGPAFVGSLWEHNKIVCVWVVFMVTVVSISPITIAFNNDLYGLITLLFNLIFMIGNTYLLYGYYGSTKSLALFHLPSFALTIIYTILRWSAIITPTLTFDYNPPLFIYSILLVIVVTISLLFDVKDVYDWFIKKDQFILRSTKYTNKLIQLQLLPENASNIQWISKDAKKLLDPNEFDSWGILRND